MKKNQGFILIGLLTFFSCQDDSPFGPDDPIPNIPMAGKINDQLWHMGSSGGRYDFSNGGLGNKIETISLYFFEGPDFQYCTSLLDTTLGPFLNVTFEPKLGRQTLGVNTFNTGFFLQNVPYQYSIAGDIAIDELDTNGIGFIRGRISYKNSTQGSPSDKVEGSFETTLCRDVRKLEFLDQPLQGAMNGIEWVQQDGIAIESCNSITGPNIRFFDFDINSDSCLADNDTFPILIIGMPTPFAIGVLSTENSGSSGTRINASAQIDPLNWNLQADLLGEIEITGLDKVNKKLSGRMDLFSNKGGGYMFNGNFEIPYFE